ncbi:uncharacterized protein LOC123526237 [Mercenaria mercenaria]|uniref:uncharacterized protein LOC123526237 n=1 Tax=Mercenaria mercenaria TaxID=6596 RepID=UPI00234EE0CE|nr:uncharacterized protein LOC123526237 [Mercenaria mercenaria]
MLRLLLFIQIPFSFAQIKREVTQKVTNANEKGVPLISRLEMKKAVDLVNKLEETKQKVCQAFDICPEIHKVAVAIGATAVSPKEIFVIQLPPLNPDADNLSGKACVKSLFRQLIMQDPLADVKQISPTNISLLLYAPRKSKLPWFYPKPTYKLPVRGKQFEFCLQSKCGQGSHDLSTNFSIVELSGFEPFDSFIDECEEISGSVDTTSHSSEGSVTADYVCIDSDHDLEIVNSTDVKDNSPNVTPQFGNSGYNTDQSANTTPKYCASLIESDTRDNKKLRTSSSTSSILSQTSVMSKESENSVTKSKKHCSVMTEEDTGVFSLTDTEFIWFQSPLLIKGYRCKT